MPVDVVESSTFPGKIQSIADGEPLDASHLLVAPAAVPIRATTCLANWAANAAIMASSRLDMARPRLEKGDSRVDVSSAPLVKEDPFSSRRGLADPTGALERTSELAKESRAT